MTAGVNIHWQFRVAYSDTDLFQVADELTEALLVAETSTPGVLDSAVSVDRSRAIVEIELTAAGGTEDEAISVGQAAITDAISATGGTRAAMLPTSLETSPMALV